jgi:hypothetical protein
VCSGVENTFNGLGEKIKASTQAIASFSFDVISQTKYTFEDTRAPSNVFRHFDRNVLVLFTQFKIFAVEGASKVARTIVGVMDCIQVVMEMDYFLGRRLQADRKENRQAAIAGHGAFAVASLGGVALWAHDLSYINLSKMAANLSRTKVFSFVPTVLSSIPVLKDMTKLQEVAASIGKMRLFRKIVKLSLVSFVQHAFALGYFCFAIDAIQKINSSRDQITISSAKWDLYYYTAELAFEALVLAGITNAIGMGLMASIAVLLAIKSYSYKTVHKHELAS